MQQRLYQKKVKDVNNLRKRLDEVWAELEQNVIDDAIDRGDDVFVPAFEPEEDFANTYCESFNHDVT